MAIREKLKKLLDESKSLKENTNKDMMNENDELKKQLKALEQLNNFKSNIQEHLECPICLESLQNPHMTRCGHRFCKTCIENYIREAQKQNKEKCCPSCREHIVSKRDLRKDEFIKRIVDIVCQDSNTEKKEKQSKSSTQSVYSF